MSSLAFLVTELQSLASETRRKHPDVREAAEKSLAILRSSPEQATVNLASDGPQSDDLLRPVFMGCATRNAKVVAISLGSLTRLIALKAVPMSAVPGIINTMNDCISQGVDIQLRILQTLTSLITNFPAIHGPLLGDALLLCFKLQESRIAVVSSTAAATLRQLVMFIVDKVVDEDRREELDPKSQEEIILPDGTSKSLGPSARDAFAIFEDLCLLANSEKPHFLKLDYLHKTLALELIESVLANYHDLFHKHVELLLLLHHHSCPLLLKALSDRPSFPLTLRCTRVVFLLLKQFSLELKTETEVFLMLLIKIIGGDSDTSTGPHSTDPTGPRPQWMRVLAMEIMRGLCSDSELMRNVYNRYDSNQPGSKVFYSLITALNRLVTERPALLGVGSQMMGIGVTQVIGESPSAYDVTGVAGMVATAASATVSGVVGMMGPEAGLSLQGSAMKLQCIDQLDKADAPAIPEAYIYLLAVQCLVSLCEGFVTYTAPVYNSIMIQKPRVAGEAVIRAPRALELATLPPDDSVTKQLRTVHDMVQDGWPALLAALSFIISTNLSDELFVDVLASYQAVINVSGMLGLTTPRDAFFTSLAKFAVPSRVVSSFESYTEPATPRTAASLTDGLGLTAPTHPPGLSERNMACLKVFIASALFLAGSLGQGWSGVLESLQNADYVLTFKGTKSVAGKRTTSGSSAPPLRAAASSGALASGAGSSASQPTRHPLLSDLDADSVLGAIQRLFDASKNLDDPAFQEFVSALCKLSSEMVGMQTEAISAVTETTEDTPQNTLSATTPTDAAHRRRVSGIHLPRTLRSGDFGITKLGGVALLNVHRLIYRSPDVAWDTVTNHLLSVLRLSAAPSGIRIQAARTLDDILVIIPRNLTSPGELQAQVQRRVIDVLAKQVIADTSEAFSLSSTSAEIRRMGLETLHQILLASGHTLVVGWETIFEMLTSVCRPVSSLDVAGGATSPSSAGTPRTRPPPLGYVSEKSYTANVKIAFSSLTLVCDSLSLLSPEHLRLCISTLGQFGRQADTNIALTAAESLLWGVSDSIQAKRKDAEQEPVYSSLWMFLLLEVLGLCTDARQEVRVGAIQTLFRSVQLYGATLSMETWNECIWKVTFPLLESITIAMRHNATTARTSLGEPSVDAGQAWNESKVLALQSIGSIFSEFLTSKIMRLESFSKVWDVFVNHIQDAVLFDHRTISAPALWCLEKAVKASGDAEAELKPKVSEAWNRVWQACDEIGNAVLRRGGSQLAESGLKPFTQESLVAFVDVIRSTRAVSRSLDAIEWPLDRLSRLTAILKGVLTYQNSPDYRPDIDALTPVQTVVIDTISDIDLSATGVPSLVLKDLSEYTTLPFVAAFDVHLPDSSSSKPRKRITYIGLCKKCMPMLVDLFLQFKEKAEIYADGTLEVVISAYSIPIKMKYECPAPSKYGNDAPLWKTSTTSFLRIVKECGSQIKAIGTEIPDDRVEGIWHQVIDVFRGAILADCSATESFPLDVQEAEENFDLALIASLEIDVVPHLGDARVPDYLIMHFAKVLHQGSKLVDFSEPDHGQSQIPTPTASPGRKSNKAAEKDRQYDIGTTEAGRVFPRERFSYWCFDLLYLICSDISSDQEPSRRRVAALSLPSLLSRCRMTLIGYIADEALRGHLPFPRVREEELIYVLRKLLEMKLWPGVLWAAFSESPSKYCVKLPPIPTETSPSDLIGHAIKRSSKAHLFHFYDVLCEIAATPRKTPTAWTSTPKPKAINGHGDEGEREAVRELDARGLARECLRDIGKEMGVEH
ncbi:hypothetical protein NEOLEDRAFT_1153423 [Neolentinus lepideus HHB14362 ss-1]|uniref:Protein MON2 homolog n=1 Tax=Neolentinus lepideus HHB14362 ss-1 TaxID=1314782 RepID=A0A165VQU7_9AGAM|nr:hypothetical protein NEOLEDRAFT_1153423 [Neolentinus lepideus HHB14362 ss-1]